MARTRTYSRRQDEGTKQRGLTDQPTPFVGLALSPVAALLVAWGLHYYIVGIRVGDRQILSGSATALGVTLIVITLAAVGLAFAAWHFSRGRHTALRYSLTGSTFTLVIGLASLVWTGPNRWMSLVWLLTGWFIVGLWSLPRLHVLRRDPNEGRDDDTDGSDLIKQLGLDGFRKKGTPEIAYDKDGDPTRIEVRIKHRFGATRSSLQGAVDNLASMLETKEGFVRVTPPDDGKSSESVLTAVLKDPFKGRVPDLGLSHPGGSVADYATVGLYDDGTPVHVWICGGKDHDGNPLNPSGYAFMGMSRAGKTVTENRLLIDGVITRSDGVILYLNQAKGGQDVQPIIAGVEVAILADGLNEHSEALRKVKDIMSYRQKQLARYGFTAWSAAKCFHNPPQQTLAGEPIPMEPMPALFVHVGESDTILERAGEAAIYLASKGLSLGVIPGWSLQRWAATSMPTDLRFNIGTAFCFGVGDDYSAGFALSEPTIKAGAHPEYWKNRYPGRFYVENVGIAENKFPTPAKGVGDTDDDTLFLNMRLTCEKWAPRMAKLDAGSVQATNGWWVNSAERTDAIRRTMTPGTAATTTTTIDPQGGKPAMTQPGPAPTPATGPARQFVNDHSDFDPDAADLLADTAAEIQSITDIDGEDILGDLITPDELDPEFAQFNAIIPGQPVEVPHTDDGIDLGGPKPEPATREEAETGFYNALRAVAADDRFVDDTDPRYVVFRVGQLQEFYPFRTRQWFSPLLSEMASGARACPPGHRVERAPDRTGEGWYRMNRVPDQRG